MSQFFPASEAPFVESEYAHDIGRDFHGRLVSIDRDVESFRVLPPREWSGNAWQGFFCELQRQLPDGDWGYVPNPAGGFIGYWWHWTETPAYKGYLQLENGKLCFKIAVETPANRYTLRDRWSEWLLEAGRSEGMSITRPRRRESGRTMTVAVLDSDYRATDEIGLLDLETTIARLRVAESVLDRAQSNIL